MMFKQIEVKGNAPSVGPQTGIVCLASGRLYNLIHRFKHNRDSETRDFWLLVKYVLEDIIESLKKSNAIHIVAWNVKCDEETNPLGVVLDRKVGFYIKLATTPIDIWQGGFVVGVNEGALIIECIE